ncbi:hypothetical protein BHE97_08265 [Aeromicrobium sp. PE09-221]|uniref:Ig-like domain-containing protein n=1 Tax=Aeromicrobium sp. PE09-221 TaxID=1898043 RepID=UPI000B3EC98A|nr:Ig-like domain-containing protein [Aeromicrobium sp. PE09-221]OUZ10325.1 hypothetical protein BHE97_08265 [Aeromicrobium sp. PE09-221]
MFSGFSRRPLVASGLVALVAPVALTSIVSPAEAAETPTDTHSVTTQWKCNIFYGDSQMYDYEIGVTVDLPTSVAPGERVASRTATWRINDRGYLRGLNDRPNATALHPDSATFGLQGGWLEVVSGGAVGEEAEFEPVTLPVDDPDSQIHGELPGAVVAEGEGLFPGFTVPADASGEISLQFANHLRRDITLVTGSVPRVFTADECKPAGDLTIATIDVVGEPAPTAATKTLSKQAIYQCKISGSTGINAVIKINATATVPTLARPGDRFRVPFTLSVEFPAILSTMVGGFGDFDRVRGYSDNIDVASYDADGRHSTRLPRVLTDGPMPTSGAFTLEATSGGAWIDVPQNSATDVEIRMPQADQIDHPMLAANPSMVPEGWEQISFTLNAQIYNSATPDATPLFAVLFCKAYESRHPGSTELGKVDVAGTETVAKVALSAPTSVRHGKATAVAVSVPGATGAVTLTGAGAAQTRSLSGGKASFVVPKTLRAGRYTLKANYAGDRDVKAGTVSRTLVVVKAGTRASVRVSKRPTSKKRGKAVVTVRSVTGTKPRGKVTVTLRKGKKVKRVSARVNARGQASVRLPKLAKGTWKFTAAYGGDVNHLKKTVKVKKLKVKK